MCNRYILLLILSLGVSVSAEIDRGPWLLIGHHPDPTTYTPATSPSGTRVPTNSGSAVDAGGAIWTLGAGSAPMIEILKDGVQAAGAFGSQILWYGGTLYVKGEDGRWYFWTGAAFGLYGSTDPESGGVPVGYFVAADGSDAVSCGTSTNVLSPKQTIGSALGCLSPGDTLYVRVGTYDEHLIETIPSGTSWGSPVTIAAYPGETVWLSPSDPAGDKVVSLTDGQSYIVLDGINMDGSAFNTEGANVVAIESGPGYNTHHIRIKNATLRGTTIPTGFDLSTNTVVKLADLTTGNMGANEFINLTVTHAGGTNTSSYGFYVQSNDNVIDHCTFSDLRGYAVQIYNGTINDNGASRNIVRNNTVTSVHVNALSPETACVIIGRGVDNQIYNNVCSGVEGTSSHGVKVFHGTGSLIYHNTIYGLVSGLTLESASISAIVRNNISYNNSASNLDDTGTSTTKDHNLTSANPLFVDAGTLNFRLQVSSPAIDTGATIGAVTTDLEGISRPQGVAYDMGAYEYH